MCLNVGAESCFNFAEDIVPRVARRKRCCKLDQVRSYQTSASAAASLACDLNIGRHSSGKHTSNAEAKLIQPPDATPKARATKARPLPLFQGKSNRELHNDVHDHGEHISTSLN